MKQAGILSLFVLGFATFTIADGVPGWIGKFKMADDGGEGFVEWLNVAAAGLTQEARETLQKKQITFEIQRKGDVSENTYSLTITDDGSGQQQQETFKIGEWMDTEYFGTGKIKVRWTNDGNNILDQELDVGGVKSNVLFDFSKGDCQVFFILNGREIKTTRYYKRIVVL